MISLPAVIFEKDLILPAGISDLDGFRRWTRDEAFPERGRIDYLAGTDARGSDLLFEIRALGPAGYERQPADPEGWRRSSLLDRRVRLVRRLNEFSRWVYDLETRA